MRILVCGAGGFIGHHLVRRLKRDGHRVRGVDLRHPDYSASAADEFHLRDLRDPAAASAAVDTAFDEVYQLAADMGGAGYLFSGSNDAAVMSNSMLINLNVLEQCRRAGVGRVFFSSSACVYPASNQSSPDADACAEDSVYPAEPDSDYGWEKLFAERLYLAFARNHGLVCRIARYHNIFGPEGAWNNGREKVPAALCRKVAMIADGGTVEIWGDGRQTRSFLHVDECVEGTLRLMRSPCSVPLNIGSQERISINDLALRIAQLAGKRIILSHVDGPQGVRGRVSDNRLIRESLGWAPVRALDEGLASTYRWVVSQLPQTAGT
jgi:GDP-D-mannose 3',5'-epimerase